MEQNERYTDKLAKYIIAAAGIAIICALCWYFRSILVYILAAVVVSLVAKPVMGLLKKIRIKGRKAPDWILAAISLITVLGVLLTALTMVIPIISNILKDSTFDIRTTPMVIRLEQRDALRIRNYHIREIQSL